MSGILMVGTELYGATLGGRPADQGTLYRIKLNGDSFETIHAFSGNGGNLGQSGLVSNGTNLFGTTRLGGTVGFGTVFEVNFDGSQFTKLHDFAGSPSDGSSVHQLVRNGSTLYAATGSGGANNGGVIFELEIDDSNYRLIHEFDPTDGNGSFLASSPIVIGETLFGTTMSGGTNGTGTIYQVGTDGSGFRLLHSFSEIADLPFWGNQTQLVASDTTLYGLTTYGGEFGNGTLFEIQLDGSGFNTLYEFGDNEGSGVGRLSLVESTLYGTRRRGGIHNDGTIFRFQVPEPTSGILSVLAFFFFSSAYRSFRMGHCGS